MKLTLAVTRTVHNAIIDKLLVAADLGVDSAADIVAYKYTITYKKGEVMTPERKQLAIDTIEKAINHVGDKLLSCKEI